MNEFLLELFVEEIPARMQQSAALGYKKIFTDYLNNKKIVFNDIVIEVAPRRIMIYINGLPDNLSASKIEIKGPSIKAPEQAIEGFCRSHNIKRNELISQAIEGNEYYFLIKNKAAENLKDLFKNNLASLISSYIWPKSMYWGDYSIKFVRPVKNILCLFNSETINFTFGHLSSNNKTYGHRFLSPNEIEITSYKQYCEALKNNYVILAYDDRKTLILNQINKICNEKNFELINDEELLEEVCGLNEYPVVHLGSINQKFMSVPAEILISSMKTHQKYFSLKDGKNNFVPYFIFVANIVPTDPKEVIHGNEKVLSARLSDALYFYNQDLKSSLKERTAKLDKVVFHAKLGTVFEKVQRLRNIVEYLAPQDNDLKEAAYLCKNDILSEVVGEFPELQGIMGYYYAKNEGRSEKFSNYIKDHYKPISAFDNIPSDNSALLAIADKIDSLSGLILADEKPSGSKDPYALRRQTIGIIRIILENNLKINIIELVKFSIKQYQIDNEDAADYIIDFIEERFRSYFKDDFEINIVRAVVNFNNDPDLINNKLKIEMLNDFLNKKTGNNLLNSFKRANNIIKDKSVTEIKNNLFQHDIEKNLYDILNIKETEILNLIEEKKFNAALINLSELDQFLEEFFSSVKVNIDDELLAKNRIALLAKVKKIFNLIANFEEL